VASIYSLDQFRRRQQEAVNDNKLPSLPFSQEDDKAPATDDEDEELEETQESDESNDKKEKSSTLSSILRSPLKTDDHGMVRRVWNRVYGWGKKSSQVLFVLARTDTIRASTGSTNSTQDMRRKLLAGITLALVLLFISATVLIFRANTVYKRLSYLTDDSIG